MSVSYHKSLQLFLGGKTLALQEMECICLKSRRT